MTFPTNLSELVDSTDSIIADHINDIEDAIGITGSSVATSINYRLGDVGSSQKVWVVGDFKMSGNSDGFGWLECDGRTIGDVGSGADLTSADYEDLFNWLETTFGFTPSDTFGAGGTIALPDFEGRTPIGASSTYTLGANFGALTIDISHTHTVASHTHTGPAHVHSGPAHVHTGPSHQHKGYGDGGDLRAAIGRNNSANDDIAFAHVAAANPNGEATPLSAGTAIDGSALTPGTISNFVPVYGYVGSAGTGNTGSAGTGNTGSSGTANTGAATPATDSVLSAAQSILQPVLSVNFLIKY